MGFMRDYGADAERDRLLGAYRKQLKNAPDRDTRAAVFLMWQGEPGLTRDDLTRVLFEVEEGREPAPRPRPGQVQESPFA